GAVKGPASVLPASVLYGGQEGLKPLSFKMCAFQGEKPLTNRLLQRKVRVRLSENPAGVL
ncbi:MAG TPA: hypothetical protein H9860_01505, partial [Candidatus Gemmiger faecavium]|nr:hypothetical protein [Candidatus Gemmiger faecavium]